MASTTRVNFMKFENGLLVGDELDIGDVPTTEYQANIDKYSLYPIIDKTIFNKDLQKVTTPINYIKNNNIVEKYFTVEDYTMSFMLSKTTSKIKYARDAAIFTSIDSSALGEVHSYVVEERNINFLNGLIVLGNGSKFTCTDINGVKARVFHTNAQLIQLSLDIKAHIGTQFDHYELKLADIAAATNQAELDAVVW